MTVDVAFDDEDSFDPFSFDPFGARRCSEVADCPRNCFFCNGPDVLDGEGFDPWADAAGDGPNP